MDEPRCEVCGGPLRAGRRTCSRACSGRLGGLLGHGGRVTRTCAWCGRAFETDAAELRRAGGRCGRFCSRACAAAARRAGPPTRPADRPAA